MDSYRFILEKYSGQKSRFTCPSCKKPKQFTKYVDTSTGAFLGDDIGRCNRSAKCGYHLTPAQSGIVKSVDGVSSPPMPIQDLAPISYIDQKLVASSLGGYNENVLVKFLNTLFKPDEVLSAIKSYKIGTSLSFYGGTTVFWQIDRRGRIRTGKLIKYNDAGHRVKGCTNWVHSTLKLKNYNLKQCFFGEHLLNAAPEKKVAIVESEKTAIIASLFIPDMVWLASGGVEGLNAEKVKLLSGHTVILFPDASENGVIYEKWERKAEQFGFDISDLLERKTSDAQKAQGFDICDFFVQQRQSPAPERVQTTEPIPEPTLEPEVVHGPELWVAPPAPKPPIKTWLIDELRSFFKEIELPADKRIKVSACSTITDLPLFIESTLALIEANNGKASFLPYLDRIIHLKKILSHEIETT